uniref:Uncharacterized protein n=1 Tax=Petromyzon marinus TaxID=7757 RepID=S4RUL1_PETMA
MLADAAGRPTSSKARLALPAMMENDTHCLDFSYQIFHSKIGCFFGRDNQTDAAYAVYLEVIATSNKSPPQQKTPVGTRWRREGEIVFEVTSSVQLSYVALADVHILNYPCILISRRQQLGTLWLQRGQQTSFASSEMLCVCVSRRDLCLTLTAQSQKGKDVMVASSHLQARRYTATYSFPTAAKDDSDKFRCVAHSTEGASVSNFASLIVREPPTPVAPPLLLRVGPTNLWVHLNANSIVGEGPIILKEVMWKQSAGTWAEVNRADSQTYKLWHLDPDTAYEIRVLLTRPGEGGTGLPGPPLITRTRCAEPKHGPLNLRVVSIRSREISLQWEPLGYNVTRCHAFNVTVCYRSWAARGPGGEECRDAGRAAHGFVLPGLPPFRNLSLQAVLMTPEGRKASERVVTHTDEDVPGPVSLERVQGVVTEETIFLQWSEPDEPNGAIVQYEVLYSAVRSVDPAFNVEDEHGQAHKPANETQHLFPALYPGTTYSFSIRASTVKGLGPSATVYFTTKISAPTLPHYGADSLIDYTDTTATILLKPAQARGAPIRSVTKAEEYLHNEENKSQCPRLPAPCAPKPLAQSLEGPKIYAAAPVCLSRALSVPRSHSRSHERRWNLPLAQKVKSWHRSVCHPSSVQETKIACVKLAKRGAPVTRNADLPDAELQTDHTMKIAGVIAGLAVLIILLGIVVYMKRRKLAKKRKENVSATRQEMTHMVNSMDRGYGDQSLTLIDDQGTFLDTHNVSTQCERRSAARARTRILDAPYLLCVFGELMYPPAQMRTAIRVADLLQHMNQMKTTEGCGFKEEYESFLDGQSAPWQVAKKEENRGKNRYGNIIAYDHSRVLLQPLDANPHSDYINANFIDGYHRPRQYVATQGPMQETVYDFWRMVWQEKSASIVMVTNLVEVGRVKCYKYWPEDEQVHGDLTVSLVHTELLAEYVIRTFTVER